MVIGVSPWYLYNKQVADTNHELVILPNWNVLEDVLDGNAVRWIEVRSQHQLLMVIKIMQLGE